MKIEAWVKIGFPLYHQDNKIKRLRS